MKKIYEYLSPILQPGYEVIGARAVLDEREKISDKLEPMLSLSGGHSVYRQYEIKGVIRLSDYPSLFMQFSQMDKTPEAVESFANAFGTLNTHDFWHVIKLENDTSNVCFVALPSVQEKYVRQRLSFEGIRKFEGQHLCFAEPLRHWYAEIDQLRNAVELWQGLKVSNEDVRKKLQDTINNKSKKVTPELYFDPSKNSLELVMYPDNLLTALWLQLALAVDGRKIYKQCENEACREWFEIGKWGSRVDKKYCDNGGKCKQAVYDAKRRRQKKSIGSEKARA